MITTVYWNLHAERQGKPCWSVLQSGKPVQHFQQLTLIKPRTHINEKKYQQVQDKGARKLCAFIKGELFDFVGHTGQHAFSYNPHKSHDFYFTADGSTMAGEFEVASFSINADGKAISTVL